MVGEAAELGLKHKTRASLCAEAAVPDIKVDVAVLDTRLVFLRELFRLEGLLGDGVQTEGVIDWITPDAMLGPARHARVVLPNPDGKWTPDSTIRAEIVTAVTDAALVVENRALQDIEGRPSVFVREADDFEVHPLTLGRSDGRATEVLGGLKPGVVYVTANSYLLKAELEKSSAEHDH